MRYIFNILFILLLFSCRNEDLYNHEGGNGNMVAKNEIDASCSVIQINPGSNATNMPSRGIIGQSTIADLDANFIKLDEDIQTNVTGPDDYEYTDFNGWKDQTKIVNAKIFSSPDNTQGIGFRSISFVPRQTYRYQEFGEDPNKEIVGYVSRMVGWYPRTYEVPVTGEGVGADVEFKSTSSYKQIEKDGMTYDCVVFKNKLDGATDLMMTDMREGRYDLSSKGFKNNNDKDKDIQPYGHIFDNLVDASGGYKYCNYFSFKHYLTAVRMYVKVDASDLSLISWKNINDVIFMDQPQTVAIALPTEQNRGTGESSFVTGATPTLPIEGVEPIWGEVMEWDDRVNMPIVKTPMAENDPKYPEFADVPTYPLTLTNTISLDKTYMGYILLEPGKDVDFEIHTDAGVYKATIPVKFGEEGSTTDILQAGNIYNIVVDMKADGSLDIVVGNEDFESFRNLTPYNNTIKDFEYSNCFIINRDMMIKTKDDNEAVTEWYDGFYFQAMVPGRGEKGAIKGVDADLYPKEMSFSPHSARILWQDVPYLVTYVELIHGYIRFSLNKYCRIKKDDATDLLQGNAVIAALDEEGNILWSWHIWVNNNIKDITYNIDTRQISVMNMNLGATESSWNSSTSDEGILKTYGFYYQWGRKDPSPLPPSYNYGQSDMTTSVFYYMDEGKRQRIYRYIDLNPTVEMGAVHPLEIIAPSQISQSYANDWLYESIDQLWGYDPTAKKVTNKTIYDPCPYGYRVPDDELNDIFRYAYDYGYCREVDGMGININLSGLDNYFPFSGWRGHDRGRTDKTNAWYEVGNLGDYQNARISDGSGTYGNYYESHRGRTFLISDRMFSDVWENGVRVKKYDVLNVNPKYYHYITLDYANRASASPVRCVRFDGEPADGTTSNP